MKTVELFCGTKSFSKFAESVGCETFTVDIEKKFNPDLVFDLTQDWKRCELLKRKIYEADIIWMSPPCTTFSMASGNKHWTANKNPKTQEAIIGLNLIKNCKTIADYCELHNKIYFIENPRARARWFMPTDETRHTVWYCKYGDKRAKPTDIWTNLKGWEGRTCFNGNKNCHHEPSPRGSRTGTQGMNGAKERGKIPPKLFKELFEIIYKLKNE